MQAEDLLSVVFPDQLACAENVAGEREVPDQPLVTQTIRDCLEDAMDVAGLLRVLKGIERGDIRVVSRDLTEPSPLSQEILNAKPYAFLDDAPLEERRTQAVVSRRWLDPQTAAELGILDQEAIDRVRDEAWPDVNDADELHDALMSLGFVTESEGSYNKVSFSASGSDSNPSTLYPNDRPRMSARNGWAWHLDQLLEERRATVLHTRSNGPVLWVAVERLPMVKAVFPGSSITPECTVPNEYSKTTWSRETATIELIRARLQGLGPVAALALAHSVGLPVGEIEAALTALETDGSVLRGSFTPGGHTTEWCERALLARIHRYTVNRLRRDIQPVPAADFMRFLFVWHRMTPNERLEGQQALSALIEQLEGVQAPANAWEEQILPARINAYEPHWLDALCLSGRVTWERLNPPRARETGERSTTPLRSTPIALLLRKNLSDWHDLAPPAISSNCALSAGAKRVSNALATNGASFFDDLLSQTGLLRTQAEKALAELVASGRVTADSFNGLRALIGPSNQRRARIGYRRMRRLAPLSLEDAGPWVSLKRDQGDSKRTAESRSWLHTERQIEAVESIALILLRRYGIVFRQLLRRETLLPSWRDLLTVYRRLEARGEIRGGRFVAGFSGEQFALPEAVGKLRAVRKSESSGQLVALSGADPLNLSGIITPGPLVPALTANRVLYRDGVAIATHARGRVEFLSVPEPGAEWATKQALLRGCNSATPRAYFK